MPDKEKDIDGKMVMPGDELACSEEFEAGENTFEDGGKIKAAAMGWAKLDVGNRIARVDPVNPLTYLEVGDTVIARVTDIKKALVITEVLKILGKPRPPTNASDGVIHVSKVANRFVDNIEGEIQIRDIVRAKVLQVSPNVQLSTQDDNHGVIYAICDQCARRLEAKDGRLYCKECERGFSRKLARDYGSWNEGP